MNCRIGQKRTCIHKGCAFEKCTGVACDGFVKKEKKVVSGATHFWVSWKYGYVFGNSAELPVKNSTGTYRYMGYTFDIGWPKKMNTGRLLHKPRFTKDKNRR